MVRKPNFLFIGPDKSGSTWLYEVLDWHPQAFMSRAKELFFFDQYFHLGPEWYFGHFKKATDCHKAIGEISHDYLYSLEAKDRIAALLPDAKLIACPREPVERAFSSYLYMYKQGRVKAGFEQAIHEVDELIDHGRYAKHLKPYIETFGREAIHAPLFDALKDDPAKFADDVFAFLNIQQTPLPPELRQPINVASRPRSFTVARLARKVGLKVRQLGRPEIVTEIKSSALLQKALYKEYREDEKPRLEPSLRESLKGLFREDVLELGELLQLDIAAKWRYR